MILDTCALLWLSHQQEKLSSAILKQIEDAPAIFVSAITGFEIALKWKAGKLELPAPPKSWMEIILAHHDISVIELDLNICIKAAELPPIHRDPCDRFIIATALLHNFPVITLDERFKQYGIKVLE